MDVKLREAAYFSERELGELKSIGITTDEGRRDRSGRNTGYTLLHMPDDLEGLEWKIASLPQAQHIIFSLHQHADEDTLLHPVAEKARYLLELETQRRGSQDGCSDDPYDRPLAFSLKGTLAEIDRQMERLRACGIDDVKIGMEVEFGLSDRPAGYGLEVYPIEGFPKASEVKAQAIRELEKQYAEAEAAQKPPLRAKIDAVREFSPREVLMYDLIERDSRTKDILQPLFGKSRDGDGYYDAEDKLELKLRHVSPQEIIKNRQQLIKVLYEKASEYGLVVQIPPAYHINSSYWAEGENVLDGNNAQFAKYTPGIVSGVAKAVSEALPVAFHSRDIKPDNPIGVTTARSDALRYASGRLEAREFEAPDTIIPILLAGAAYGIDGTGPFKTLPTKKVLNPTVHHTPGVYKITAHILNESLIEDDGHLGLSRRNIQSAASNLASELLGVRASPRNEALLDGLQSFFSQASIVKNGGGQDIAWPTTGPDEYVMPVEGRTFRIDIAKLRENLRLSRIDEKYITVGAHQPKQAPKGSENYHARKMLESPFLRDTLSEPFMDELRAAVNERSTPGGHRESPRRL